MQLDWLCRCLLWESALRVAICTLCQLENYNASSSSQQNNKYRGLLDLLQSDQIVYASFLKATHLLAALPTLKVSGDPDPPLCHVVDDVKQVIMYMFSQLRRSSGKHCFKAVSAWPSTCSVAQAEFLQARNNVNHSVNSVTYVISSSGSGTDSTATSLTVLDSQGAFWWTGVSAYLSIIWLVHEAASRELLAAQSQMPEDLRIQRGPNPKNTMCFRDPTAFSGQMEKAINHKAMWTYWQMVVDRRSKRFLLAEATDELPPLAAFCTTSGQIPRPTLKRYAAFAELTGVVTSLHASRGDKDAILWTKLVGPG